MPAEHLSTGLHKTGSLAKLDKGAKKWSEASSKVKAVRLQDGVFSYADGPKQAGTKLDLHSVSHLCSSVCPGAPAGAFDMTVRSKPPRTYTFSAPPGESNEDWLRMLASSVPDSAVHENLRILFRKPALVGRGSERFPLEGDFNVGAVVELERALREQRDIARVELQQRAL